MVSKNTGTANNKHEEIQIMKSTVKLYIPLILIVLFSASCQSNSKVLNEQGVTISTQGVMLSTVKQAEERADEPGKAILQTGRKMVLERDIIPGTCWTWVNECFNRAGYGANKHIAFRGKKGGPYVNTEEIKPGDWLYFVNHSYRNIGHSGIFVCWVDKNRKIGLTLSYGGRNKKEPGRYRKYLLNDVYYITRPGTVKQF